MKNMRITNNLIREKTVREEEFYDEHSTGVGILCIPLNLAENLDSDNEICVPEYYFRKYLDEQKVYISADKQFIIADFYYDNELGAFFR